MKMRKEIAVIMALFMLTGISACSSTNKTPTATSATQQAGQVTTIVQDPFGKYDPQIKVTSVYAKDSTEDKGFGPNNTIEDNVWSRLAEQQLGVKLSYKWIVTGGDQLEQKMNVSIASNDLPDIIPVNIKQLGMLINSGYVADLTEAINNYASPLLKETFDLNKTMVYNAGAQGGKVFAIPASSNAANILNAEMLFVRKDWLTKLGLPEPKTMQDVLAISSAFTHDDPDGNGIADTIGLAINKSLSSTGFTDLGGFFEGFHAYPYNWMKDASGQINYGAIQPQTKDALAKLQIMFKDGQIDKEFGVKDAGKEAELISSGKCGMEFGLAWNPMYPLNLSNQNDPKADWVAYPLPSVDDKVAQPVLPVGTGSYFAVNKSYAHPEVFIKLLNQYAEKGFGKTADRSGYYDAPDGSMLFKLQVSNFQFTKFDEERTWFESVHNAFASNDQSKLIDGKAKIVYDNIVDYKNGNTKGKWEWYKFYDYDIGSVGINLRDYLDGKNLLYDQFFGAPTPTMSEKWATLVKMEDEVFTNIIIGSSLSDYDKFVSDWKNLGGDAVIKEVNDWYAARK